MKVSWKAHSRPELCNEEWKCGEILKSSMFKNSKMSLKSLGIFDLRRTCHLKINSNSKLHKWPGSSPTQWQRLTLTNQGLSMWNREILSSGQNIYYLQFLKTSWLEKENIFCETHIFFRNHTKNDTLESPLKFKENYVQNPCYAWESHGFFNFKKTCHPAPALFHYSCDFAIFFCLLKFAETASSLGDSVIIAIHLWSHTDCN